MSINHTHSYIVLCHIKFPFPVQLLVVNRERDHLCFCCSNDDHHHRKSTNRAIILGMSVRKMINTCYIAIGFIVKFNASQINIVFLMLAVKALLHSKMQKARAMDNEKSSKKAL